MPLPVKTLVPLALAGLGVFSPLWAETLPIQILSATVKDQRIAEATVIVQKNGAQSATGTTDAQGTVSLSTQFADTEDTLLIVKKPGYSNLVAKCPCKGMTYAISPVMKNLDGLRVVLNWGASPEDLDSHIAFPSRHIYWERKTAAGAKANLDVDDTNSYGPETITIEKKQAGQNYVYAVHDYTNFQRPNASALSQSNAKVMVYIGQSLVRSYYVPKNQPGNLWTVFRITGDGEFQDINTLRSTNVTNADHVLGTVETYLDTGTRIEAQRVSTGDTENAKSLNRAGEQAYHAGNLDSAIDLYQEAINLDPNYGQAYSNQGLAYQKAGRTAEAIWANRKAIALASGATAATVRASSYFNIGRIYEEAGQFSDALAQFEAAKREKANPAYDKAIARVKTQIR